MKKVYRKVSILAASLLGSLFAWWGTSSCISIGPRVEYGTPEAEFEVKATVLSDDNSPVKGLQVQLLDEKGKVVKDTEYTNRRGEVELEEEIHFLNNQERKVRVVDVDGAQNGLWENKEITVRVKDSYVSQEGRWRKKAEQKVTIRMTRKR